MVEQVVADFEVLSDRGGAARLALTLWSPSRLWLDGDCKTDGSSENPYVC